MDEHSWAPHADPGQREEYVRRGRALVREKRRLQLDLGDLVLRTLGPRSENDEVLQRLAREIRVSPAALVECMRLAATHAPEDRASGSSPTRPVPPGQRWQSWSQGDDLEP